jgi:hypothetical protein
MITARNGLGGVGIQAAALAFGGNLPPTNVSCTEAFICSNNTYNMSVAGEFLVGSNTTSSPTYPSGSSASMYVGFYTVVIGGKTYFIFID